MTIDEYTLIADLFGKRRSETRPAESRTSTIVGVATSDSEDGSVKVRLNGDVTGGEDGEVVIPTEAHIVKGDVVSVSLVGGTAKAPRVTGTVGGGDRTYEFAATAHEAAVQAVADAADAKAAAEQAEADAERAADAAEAAEASAGDAADAATAAQTSAGNAADAATAAQASAGQAATAATNAQASAGQAATAATNAQNSAGQAATSAQNAANSASAANTAANSALTQLSIVEDVAGTLDWISKHGTYTATSDTTVQEGTVYFEKDGNDYTPVIEPTGNPHSQGWYVLDVTDSQSDFIMAHLAVTSRGLWVLPSGVGSSTTPASGESQADSDARQGSGYKLLLSSNGTYIYDSTGALVITYGANIEPSQDRPFYIGDPNSTSYILFTPASAGTPASISIGGTVKIGNSKTLSELLEELEEKAARGTGILKITTAPSSYTTTTGGFTPTYRISLSTVKSEAGVSEVIVGDVIEQSYYHYPVGYVDSNYVYTGARTSIRGATGTGYYTYVRYSANSDGSSMTTTPQSNTEYIGIYTGTSSSAPTSAGSYTWSKYVGPQGPQGEQGVQGPQGEQGEQGIQGETGAAGSSVTITSKEVKYQASTSGTTTPTGTWQTSVPSVAQGSYLWTRTIVNYSTGDSTTSYSVSRMGVNGTNGTSVTVSSTAYAYQLSTSGTTVPTGTWQTTPQAPTTTQYAWTRTTTTFSDGSTATTYTVGGKVGEKGDTGDTGPTGPTAQWYYGTALTHTSDEATLPTSSTSGVVVGSMYLNTQTSLCYKCTAISGSNATWTYAGNLTDGIDVGGRNLLLGRTPSTTVTVYGITAEYDAITHELYIHGTNTKTDAAWSFFSYSSKVTEPLIAGENYTLTVYGTGFDNTGLYAQLNTYANGTQVGDWAVGGRFSRSTQTSTCRSTYEYHDAFANLFIGIMPTVTTVDARIRFKFERGNVATDWTPAPEDLASASDSVEYIVGTQTAATNVWTGVTKDSAIYTGKKIAYYLPFDGNSSAATLNLTLSGGGTTGAKNVRWNNTNVTTHYPKYSVIQLVYDGTYWRTSAYNSDTMNRKRIENAVKIANANMTKYCIAGHITESTAANSGYKMVASGVAIDLQYPVAYLNQNTASGQSYAVAANGTTTNFYTAINSVSLTNTKSGWTGTQYAMCFLKGTVNGNKFTVHSDVFTTTAPTTDDGYVYIPVGMTYSTTQVNFDCDNSLYAYIDGKFRQVTTTEVVAEQDIYCQSDSILNVPSTPNGEWVTATAESVDEDVMLRANMLDGTPIAYNRAGYNVYDLLLSESLVAETEYVLHLFDVDVSHSAKSAADLGVMAYYNGGNICLGGWKGTGYFTDGHADVLSIVFTPHTSSNTTTSGGNVYSPNNLSHPTASTTPPFIRLYNSVPSVSGTMSMTVGSWHMAMGGAATSPAWTTKPPTFRSLYPVTFVAKQRKRLDGTIVCTAPVVDDTSTVINGSNIVVGRIDASRVDVVNLNASNITTGTMSAEHITGGTLTVMQMSSELQGQIDKFDDDSTTLANLKSSHEALEGNVAAFTAQTTGVVQSHDGTLRMITNRMQFLEGKLILDASGDPNSTANKAVLTTDKLAFESNGAEVAYISNEKLYVTNAQVLDTMQMGGFAWIPRSNGNLSLKWVGGVSHMNLLRDTESIAASGLVLTRATVPSAGIIRLTPTTSAAYAKFKVNYLDYAQYGNGTYTFSFDARLADVSSSYTENNVLVYAGYNLSSRLTSTLSSSYDRYNGWTFSSSLTSSWQRYSGTFAVPTDLTTGKAEALAAGSYLTVQLAASGSKKPVEVRNVKLEIGTEATPWSKNPND